MSRLEVVYEDATFHVATCQNLVAMLWCEAPTAEQLRAFERIGRRVGRASKGTGVLWNVMLRGTPRFSEEARGELVRLMRGEEFLPRANAHIILVPGVAGAAVRAFMNTAVLLGRSKLPARFFGDPGEAATWLAPHLAGTALDADREQLLELHAELVQRAG